MDGPEKRTPVSLDRWDQLISELTNLLDRSLQSFSPPPSVLSLLLPEEILSLSSRFRRIISDPPRSWTHPGHLQDIRDHPGATASRDFGEQLLGHTGVQC